MNILITGGSGYVGTRLIPELLKLGHNVVSIDTQWFGHYLEDHPNLVNIKDDIRNISRYDLSSYDSAIHLANIANDPAVDLNPNLSWEINVLASYELINQLSQGKCQSFMFGSSGSVYGIKDEPKVTEDLDPFPISTYNKTKMIAERVFKSFEDHMKVFSIRPATVCGLSKRMRLDVAVNLLTMAALTKNEITVLGGDQKRPNVHIEDMVGIYLHFLNNYNNIDSGFYNAGFENLKIIEIAEMISKKTGAKIVIKDSNDPRSYNQCSDKLLKTGFKPSGSVSKAIDELIKAYNSKELIDDPNWYTVATMKRLGLG